MAYNHYRNALTSTFYVDLPFCEALEPAVNLQKLARLSSLRCLKVFNYDDLQTFKKSTEEVIHTNL